MGSGRGGFCLRLALVGTCLLIVYAICINNLKSYPLTRDENSTIFRILNPYNLSLVNTPLETLRNVAADSQQHGPLYFILASLWGAAAGTELITLRYLSVLFAVLTVAAVYRLASITGSWRLAFFAALIASCTAFFHSHTYFARMYSLLPFCAAWVVWSYWKLQSSPAGASKWLWLSLFASTAAILYVHYYGIFILAAVGIYHLLCAPKDRRWLQICLVMTAGGLVFLAWLPVALEGLITRRDFFAARLNPVESLQALLSVYANGLWYLGIVLMVIVCWRWRRLNRPVRFLMLITCFAVGAAMLTNEFTAVFVGKRMRYHIVFLPLFAAAFAIALTFIPLPRGRRALVQIMLLIALTLSFHQFSHSDELTHYTNMTEYKAHALPPIHSILYHPAIVLSDEAPILSLHPSAKLHWFVLDYYAKRYDVSLVHIFYDDGTPVIQTSGKIIPDLSAFVAEYGSFWLIYKPHEANPQTMSSAFQWMHNYYRSCGRTIDNANEVIEHFVRDSAPC